MRPTSHAIISAGFAAMLWGYLSSPWAALACFLSGIFIDLDHHIDYIIARRRIPWTYKELLHYCMTEHNSKMYLLFHSYEMLLVLWLCVYYWQLNVVWIGLAVGLTQHMVCDQFVNPIKPLGYFMVYRIKYGFERQKLLKLEAFQRLVERSRISK